MGQEITHSHFKKSDFDGFRNKLDAELDWVKKWFNKTSQEQIDGSSEPGSPYQESQSQLSAGFEMELCLVDPQGDPASLNEVFLQHLKTTPIASQVSLELAQFNLELNSLVFNINSKLLSNLRQEVERLWIACNEIATEIGCSLIMIGTLPSLREEHLKLVNMSPMKRYKALNEQVLRSRKGRAIELDIQGRDSLKSSHQDVMLESVATSFQLHLQMPFSRSVRYYNAAIILSAPIVAVSANSPFLFGKALWSETRIPAFEQAVSVGGFSGAIFGPIKRVSFGSDYARNSLLECFQENNEHYPILLPEIFNSPVEQLAHLNLHNGTVWRWNRPLIGSADTDSEHNKKRQYHVRLEHRVIPAGPTIVDSIANAAFFYGAVTALANQYDIPEQQLAFVQAKDNFYLSARQGLNGKVIWFSGQSIPLKTLIVDHLLPLAKNGLAQMGIERQDIDYYLDIIEQRTKSGQNGANWQRCYVEKHGKDMQALTLAYQKNQQGGRPVHEWQI